MKYSNLHKIALFGLLLATALRAESPLDLFTAPDLPPAEAKPDSRDLKGWDAKRQQDDAERIQNAQAMAKTILKQGKELERMTTNDPGRKAQLTQEINRLQYEITAHLQQGQALNDTAKKAEYAAKQAEAGNAKKGREAETAKLQSVENGGEGKSSEDGSAVARDTSADSQTTGDVAKVLPEAVAARGVTGGSTPTSQVGFNDEAKEADGSESPSQSKQEIVSSAQAAFEQRLNQLSVAPKSTSIPNLEKEIQLSDEESSEDPESRSSADAKAKANTNLSSAPGSQTPRGSGNSLLDLLRNRVASATAELGNLRASLGLAGVSALPDALRAGATESRGLASEQMPLSEPTPENVSHRLIAGSNRLQRNRIPATEPDPL
ncbi:MAG: hypothetical protein KDD51_05645 [Bdellovibrionales bacterium]|nr:hypothetical protein [Bdellovibrionales bacterium]